MLYWQSTALPSNNKRSNIDEHIVGSKKLSAGEVHSNWKQFLHSEESIGARKLTNYLNDAIFQLQT